MTRPSPDGTNIVCYWDPDSQKHIKYWAIRQGDELLRFCMEDACYDLGYSVKSFTDVLGQSGFVVNAPRGVYVDKNTSQSANVRGVSRKPQLSQKVV